MLAIENFSEDHLKKKNVKLLDTIPHSSKSLEMTKRETNKSN